MVNALGIALIWLAAAPPAGALEVQRLGEVQLEAPQYFSFDWLDTRRYVQLDSQHAKTSTGRRMTVVIADVLEQKSIRVPFRLYEFVKPRTDLPHPVPNISFFKSDRALLRFDRDFALRQPGVAAPLPLFCFWKPDDTSGCEPKELGNVEPLPPTGSLRELGPDPTESHLYSAIHVYDGKPLGQAHLLSLRLFRVPLSDETLTSDWEMSSSSRSAKESSP